MDRNRYDRDPDFTRPQFGLDPEHPSEEGALPLSLEPHGIIWLEAK